MHALSVDLADRSYPVLVGAGLGTRSRGSSRPARKQR